LPQLLSSQGLAAAARYFDDASLHEAHARNLVYLRSLIRRDGAVSFIQGRGGWLPVNETAFAVMTLISSPRAEEHRALTASLGEFLLLQQREDGKFWMWHPPEENESRPEKEEWNRQRFASGEAALACVDLYEYTDDKRYLQCARKAYTYYFPRIQKKFHPSFGSWHTIAYARLYLLERDKRYLSAVRFLAEELLALQNEPRRALKSSKPIPGGFDRRHTWHTSAEAVFTEALGFASRAAAASTPLFSEQLREANLLGFYNLRFLQFRHYTDPRARGGIQSESSVDEIQVDNIGHALMAFYEYATREEARE